MEFSRQEYWSGLPFPSPGDLPYPGIEPGSRHILYCLSHQGSTSGEFLTLWATPEKPVNMLVTHYWLIQRPCNCFLLRFTWQLLSSSNYPCPCPTSTDGSQPVRPIISSSLSTSLAEWPLHPSLQSLGSFTSSLGIVLQSLTEVLSRPCCPSGLHLKPRNPAFSSGSFLTLLWEARLSASQRLIQNDLLFSCLEGSPWLNFFTTWIPLASAFLAAHSNHSEASLHTLQKAEKYKDRQHKVLMRYKTRSN